MEEVAEQIDDPGVKTKEQNIDITKLTVPLFSSGFRSKTRHNVFRFMVHFFQSELIQSLKKKQENLLLTKITTLFITQFTVATARKSKFKI